MRPALFVGLAVTGLGLGAMALFSNSSGTKTPRREMRTELVDSVNRESLAFERSFQATLGTLQNEVLLLRLEPARMDSQRKILLLAEAPVEGSALGPIAQFFRRSQQDFPQAEAQALLNQAYTRWQNAPLGLTAVGMRSESKAELFPIRLDHERPEEKVWLTFRDGKSQIFAFLDPAEAFELPAREGDRAYVISDSGSVLAHSIRALNGTSMSGTGIFSKASGGNGAVEATSWEGMPVVARYLRVGNSPVQIAIEQKIAQAPVDSGFELFSHIREIFGFCLGVSILATIYWFGRKISDALGRRSDESAHAESRVSETSGAVAALPPKNLNVAAKGYVSPPSPSRYAVSTATPQIPLPDGGAVIFAQPDFDLSPRDARESGVDVIAGPVGSLVGGKIVAAQPIPETSAGSSPDAREAQLRLMRAELASYQHALKLSQHESELLAEFEAEASRLRDPKAISVRMVTVAARLCASPALFFSYEDRLRGCRIASESGIGPGRLDGHVAFPLHDSTTQWLQAEFAAGRWPSLTEYPPLAKLMLDRLGVAHFEAWPLMGNGPLGRMSGRARILGVLVILQSGVDSYAKKDSLQRMLRSTGLIYENTLLAR